MKFEMIYYSVPYFNVAFSSYRVHGSVILVKQNSVYTSVAMSLQLSEVLLFYVDHADVSIRATNSNGLGVLIECATVGDDITTVNGHDLLNHSNIPDLQNTI